MVPGGGRLRVETGAHRLVALAFLGPPPSARHEVHHLDGDKGRNRPGNLAWVEHAENMAANRALGASLRGTRNPASRLTDAQLVELRALASEGALSQREFGRRFGIAQSTVHGILAGRTYR